MKKQAKRRLIRTAAAGLSLLLNLRLIRIARRAYPTLYAVKDEYKRRPHPICGRFL